MFKLIFILFLLHISSFSYSSVFLSTDLTKGSTSDNIDYSIFKISGTLDKNDPFWPYKNESSNKSSLEIKSFSQKQKGDSLDFSYNDLSLTYSYKVTEKIKLNPKVGLYKLKNFDNSITKSELSLNTEFVFSNYLSGNLLIKDGLLLEQVFLIRDNPQTMLGTRISLNTSLRLFNQKLHTDIKLSNSELMFDTTRKELDLQFMYLVSSFPHWIRLGAGYNKMTYNQSVANYWSPETFFAYGPRADIGLLLKENIQFILGVNYNWFKENNGDLGTGYYLQTGFIYGLRDNWDARLLFEKGESLQNGTTWTSDSIKLALNVFI